ncbi:MAG: thermopsin family protease [Thermoplasmata archaeon]
MRGFIQRCLILALVVVMILSIVPTVTGNNINKPTNNLTANSISNIGNRINIQNIKKIQKNVQSLIDAKKIPSRYVYEPNFYAIYHHTNTTGPAYPSSPAPMGIADYGISTKGAITYNTSSFEGILNLSSFSAYYNGNNQLETGSPNWVSIQMNTILYNTTVMGNNSNVYWTQNVIDFNGTALQFMNNIWNFTNSNMTMSNSTLYKYNGTIVAPTFYYAIGPMFNITYPFTVKLYNNVTTENNMVALYFNYSLSYGGKVYSGYYDRVLFNNKGINKKVTPAFFQVSGKFKTPLGIPDDAELVTVGPGAGSTTTITNISGYDTLKYLSDTTKEYTTINAAYNSGSETGETSIGIATWWKNVSGTPIEYLGTGPSLLMPLWNTSHGALPGSININTTVNPSYAFIFASQANPNNIMALNNSSYIPTTGSGKISFKLPPGNYTLEALANGYNPYFTNATIGTNGNYGSLAPISMTAHPNLYYTPVYITNNNIYSQMATAGLLGGKGSTTDPYAMNNTTISLNPLFLIGNDFGYESFVLLQVNGTSSHFVINNVSTDSTVEYIYGNAYKTGVALNSIYAIGDSSNITITHIKYDNSIATQNGTIILSSIYGISIINTYNSMYINVVNNNISLLMGGVALTMYTTNYSVVRNNMLTNNIGGYFNGIAGPITFIYMSGNDSLSYNNVSNDYYGIYEYIGNNNIITNNQFYNNGVSMVSQLSTNELFNNNSIKGNGYGNGYTSIQSNKAIISNNDFIMNSYDIYYMYTNSTMVYNNIINGTYGLELVNSTKNVIYNNIITTQGNYANMMNTWNITPKNGTNIIGGPKLGGNYWSGYNTLNVSNGLGLAPFNDFGMIYGYDYAPLVHVGVPIAFNETGLPKGTIWGVTFNNITKQSNTTSTIFHISSTTGKLPYTINAPNGYVLKGSVNGIVTLNGKFQVVNVTFAKVYTLIVNETGLNLTKLSQNNGSWGIILTTGNVSTTYSSIYSSLYANITNGTSYSYKIFAPGYVAIPSSGSFTVNGNVTINVVFKQWYNVTFRETGLKAGTIWGITVGMNYTKTTTSNNVSFELLNGIYNYTTMAVNGYSVNPASGSFNLTSNMTIAISYSYIPKYNVTFVENGLPVNTTWSVTLNGVTQKSTGNKIVFSVVNGKYSYTVSQIANYTVSPSNGSFAVNGSAVSINITYTYIPKYNVTFVENGLPVNTTWSVTLNGVTQKSTGNKIVFLVVNGKYSYTVSQIANYTVSPSNGSFAVNGSAVSITITYTHITSTSSSTSNNDLIYAVIGVIVLIIIIIVVIMLYKMGKKSSSTPKDESKAEESKEENPKDETQQEQSSTDNKTETNEQK